MSFLVPIDNYCERIDVQFLSEPINTITNLAFFIAAWLLWKTYCRHHEQDHHAKWLIALIAVVGLGSTIFHTFANKLAMLADVLPIGVFVYVYLYLSFRRFLGLKKTHTLLALIAFTGIAVLASKVPGSYNLNGSIMYVPCLAVLTLMALAMKNLRRETAKTLGTAALCFTLSLTFRSVDMAICSTLPIGTHFLWHCLNGIVLYLLVAAFMRHPK